MRDYTKGYTINNNELKKLVNSIVSEKVDEYKTALEKTVGELYEEGAIAWFKQAGFPHSYRTMQEAIRVKTRVSSGSRKVTIRTSAFIDSSLYDIQHTRLYQQRGKYPDMSNPLTFIVEDLQWNQGIVGLPEQTSSEYVNDSHQWWVNYHFHSTTPLKDFMEHKFKWTWKKRFHKYLRVKEV